MKTTEQTYRELFAEYAAQYGNVRQFKQAVMYTADAWSGQTANPAMYYFSETGLIQSEQHRQDCIIEIESEIANLTVHVFQSTEQFQFEESLNLARLIVYVRCTSLM